MLYIRLLKFDSPYHVHFEVSRTQVLGVGEGLVGSILVEWIGGVR